jgi:hypothetical protein
MKFIKIIFGIAILTIITTSCRKEIPVANRPYDYLRNDFASVFESFWTGMNNNYIFWDIDPTDWDAIYKTYKPKFTVLDIKKDEDVVKAYQYLVEMTKDLVDGHYAVQISSPLSRPYAKILSQAGYDSIISPSRNRHIQNGNFRTRTTLDTYIWNQLPGKYLKSSFLRLSNIEKTGLSLVLGKVDTPEKNICYFYFNSFNFTNISEDSRILNDLFDAFSDPSLDGVIIDLRGNRGGYVNDLNILWGSLLTGKEILAGYTRTKIGEGRLDYGPKIPFIVKPVKQLYQTDIPTNPRPTSALIVVLADLNSVSAAEISTMIISHLPNGYFVGETTWGGQSALRQNSFTIDNAGTFHNFFMSTVYTPFCLFEYANGKIYEGIGFSPKDAPRGYEVRYNATAIAAGQDPQLEKAIEIITNK